MIDTTPKDHALAQFAMRLRDARVRKGWNQSELARRAAEHMPDGKFGRDNISNYERGVSLPRDVALTALAEALGVDQDQLLSSRGIPTAEDRVIPFDMKSADDGNVWLKVNQKIPFAAAAEIMQILARVGAKTGA